MAEYIRRESGLGSGTGTQTKNHEWTKGGKGNGARQRSGDSSAKSIYTESPHGCPAESRRSPQSGHCCS